MLMHHLSLRAIFNWYVGKTINQKQSFVAVLATTNDYFTVCFCFVFYFRIPKPHGYIFRFLSLTISPEPQMIRFSP